MVTLMWHGNFPSPLPQQFSGFSIQAKDFKLMFGLRSGIATGSASPLLGIGRRWLTTCRRGGGSWILRRGRRCRLARRDCSGDEDPVSPDDRRRIPASWNFSFPFDVAGVAPDSWSIAARHAVEKRPAPLRPVCLLGGLSRGECAGGGH